MKPCERVREVLLKVPGVVRVEITIGLSVWCAFPIHDDTIQGLMTAEECLEHEMGAPVGMAVLAERKEAVEK